MENYPLEKIRNLAIIAHVDHGKTTLVDGLLKQSHVFRESSSLMQATAILDSGGLEKERGITILAKNTAIDYQGYLINIIDTPGHVDFGGEVERVLNMADGALLVIDSQEGPRPQTKFVLNLALKLGLRVIVVINKIDKKDARVPQTVRETENLFLELASNHEHLDYPVLYAVGRGGKAWEDLPPDFNSPGSLEPLFKKIISFIPSPRGDLNAPFQMLVSSLDYDSHQGKYALGRISRGRVKKGDRLSIITEKDEKIAFNVSQILINFGLEKMETPEALVGEIILLSGSPDFNIGDTVADYLRPEALPRIAVAEPTLKIALSANTSPFAGREGKFSTARQIKERINKELEINVSLKIEATEAESTFLIYGRGELHLSVFIETLRREGYEFEVGKPEVVVKEIGGVKMEPYEEIQIDVPEEYAGAITGELGRRRAELQKQEMGEGSIRLFFKISTRGTLGLRSLLLNLSRGTAVLNSAFLGFEPLFGNMPRLRNGVIIASEGGKAVAYGLEVAQGRGATFIDPSTEVYEGMIVGLNSREDDLEVNVCKEKKQSNVRASTSDFAIKLVPKVDMGLEQYLNFLEDDELLEVTPKSLRLRKKLLGKTERVKSQRQNRSK